VGATHAVGCTTSAAVPSGGIDWNAIAQKSRGAAPKHGLRICAGFQQQTFHRDATRFWYAGVVVAILTLVSMPLLRLRDPTRRRLANAI
jgi:hypothetical protein